MLGMVRGLVRRVWSVRRRYGDGGHGASESADGAIARLDSLTGGGR